MKGNFHARFLEGRGRATARAYSVASSHADSTTPMFGKLVNKVKDIGLQFVATWISNKYLNKLGTVTNLQLDTEKQEISLTLDLKGEQTPIDVTLH